MNPFQFLEFQRAVTSLKNVFSIGCDVMSASLFVELAEVLSQPLLFIFLILA